jgi:hypothetical protein
MRSQKRLRVRLARRPSIPSVARRDAYGAAELALSALRAEHAYLCPARHPFAVKIMSPRPVPSRGFRDGRLIRPACR